LVAKATGAASSSRSAAASNTALDAIEIERKHILADCRKGVLNFKNRKFVTRAAIFDVANGLSWLQTLLELHHHPAVLPLVMLHWMQLKLNENAYRLIAAKEF